MASTKVDVRDNRELRRVEALDPDGEVAGFAEYQISVDGDVFDFHHTEVDDRFEGQGVGSQLAAGVVEFARSEGIRIQPTCSFIRSYMDQHEDTQDVRVEEPSDDDEQDEQDNEQEDEQDDAADEDRDDEDDQDDDQDDDQGDDEQGDEHDDGDGDQDSPDAGPADAKAAGSGGATDEEESRA